ncbi:IS110 family transposase [Leptolyngbya sp. DQ-M1]|uniref:hypothetical protein n=1 Tax=Leptolyngbya sp. DQ-M1 TaxID=2933920 RepID=UPI00329A5C70
MSRVGNARLRKALFLPAMAAKRFNPLGAAMRKLLHPAYGVLKSGRLFDPNFAAPTA